MMMPVVAGASDIKTKVLADGTTLIYNETEAQRARRTATRLLPVPRADVDEMIGRHARQQNLSRQLVQAVVQVESGYNAKALSSKGARGLMQLMPETARMLGVVDAYDPEQNLRGGTTYLRQLIDRYDDNMTLALAAYNAGPTTVDHYGGVPPYQETRNYIRKVLGLYRGTVPRLLQEHARTMARKRQRDTESRRTTKPKGNRVYVVRDENNQVVLTTTPPGSSH